MRQHVQEQGQRENRSERSLDGRGVGAPAASHDERAEGQRDQYQADRTQFDQRSYDGVVRSSPG